MIETDSIKIIYSKENDEFKVVKGTVNLGYTGVYNTCNIQLGSPNISLKKIFEPDKEDDYYTKTYSPLKDYLRADMTNDEIAKGLSDFYNSRIKDINKHQTALNQLFLIYILYEHCFTNFPFWEECSDYVITDNMPDCDESDIEDEIYSDETVNIVYKVFDDIYKRPNNGKVDNSTPAEDIYRKYFPMFNLNKFLSDIEGEYLTFKDANISFQCSGKGQALEIACGAYAQITADNSFYDWHNH